MLLLFFDFTFDISFEITFQDGTGANGDIERDLLAGGFDAADGEVDPNEGLLVEREEDGYLPACVLGGCVLRRVN